MAEIAKKTKRVEYYITRCSVCDKEVEVCNKEIEGDYVCYDCKSKIAIDKALHNLEFLKGAEIIEIEPRDMGHCTDEYELSTIRVKAKDGAIVEFTAGGYDERYIEWEFKDVRLEE